jgi:hypothetical protein
MPTPLFVDVFGICFPAGYASLTPYQVPIAHFSVLFFSSVFKIPKFGYTLEHAYFRAENAGAESGSL